MYKTTYEQQGYVVIPGVLSPVQVEELNDSILHDLFQIVFRDERRVPSYRQADNMLLLTNYDLRKKKLSNPECVWENGNARQPIYTKTSGMVNLCYNPLQQEYVHFNPTVVEHIANLYNEHKLAYLHGPDRVSVKVRGTNDMPLHLDHNLFHRLTEPGLDGRFEERVQALVCGSIPTDVDLQESGTIALIPYFHHYFVLAKEFFHPQRGWRPLTDKKRPFHKLGKEFLDLLDDFNDFIREYTPVYHALKDGQPSDSIRGNREVIQFAEQHFIDVPEECHTLELTPLACEPGDLICFNQKLPHRNLRNNSLTPRIAYYVRLFKIPEGWHGGHEHQALLARTSSGVAETEQRQARSNSLERTILGRDGSYQTECPAQRELYNKLTAQTPYR